MLLSKKKKRSKCKSEHSSGDKTLVIIPKIDNSISRLIIVEKKKTHINTSIKYTDYYYFLRLNI